MRTYVECIPCFFKLALEQSRLFTANELVHKQVMDAVAQLVPHLSLGLTPPEMAREMHKVFKEKFGWPDIYKKIKEDSNRRALDLYPQLKDVIARSNDRFLTAVELAIAGNVIDYAAKNNLNIEEEIHKLLSGDLAIGPKNVFEYDVFKKDLEAAQTILYLADNAGEIVFDRVFIEEFYERKNVIVAVRDTPILNDATMEDAIFCGVDKVARVISSGVDAPGTVLKYCSEEFLKIFKSADLIISKGQGNYEALSEERGPIYFLFKVKCPVIARHCEATLGDIVLKRN
ncbi:MAG: DUF89 family protein [Methanomicrobia archaeon]|nr:DUF89 family protein [Methanomicrobia archaeon]